ncbi:MAG: DUF1249 domain-containing protein [Endozoicomonas sp.]
MGIMEFMKRFPRKSDYQVNLIRLQQVCEANYQHLMVLLPNLDQEATFYFPVLFSLKPEAPAWLTVTVIERSPYTTLLKLDMSLRWVANISPPKAEVRLYHDVMMAEVVHRKSSQRIEPRYKYPNPSMHQPDEKEQHNLFLSQWLEHVIAGQSIDTQKHQL